MATKTVIFLAITLILISGCASSGAFKSTGEYIDDAAMTARIKARLIADPVVHAFTIDVDTNRGEVVLTGSVASEEERRRAVEIARKTPGVKKVRYVLQVRGETQSNVE
jgi:hyperosmotically inducible protein